MTEHNLGNGWYKIIEPFEAWVQIAYSRSPRTIDHGQDRPRIVNKQTLPAGTELLVSLPEVKAKFSDGTWRYVFQNLPPERSPEDPFPNLQDVQHVWPLHCLEAVDRLSHQGLGRQAGLPTVAYKNIEQFPSRAGFILFDELDALSFKFEPVEAGTEHYGE